MSDEEEPAPCVPVSENDSEDDDAGSDAEQTSMTQKRCKTCVTKYEDEYAGEALSVKANKGKFLGLRAEKPVKSNLGKTTEYSAKDLTIKHGGKRHAKGSRQVFE